jgi:hypothetical protein
MNEFSTFSAGVADALSDLAGGWVPSGGPTETGAVTLNYLVNELRVGVGATDAYIAGYLSVLFRDE